MEQTNNKTDRFFMRRALALAQRGAGTTSPNPCVGAVVVRRDAVIGAGWHVHPGGPHAEVVALQSAGERAQDSTLYVTLEPCNHLGRTGPCTEALLSAGVKRVVFAMKDPNPNVAGGGAERLRSEGVEVVGGVLENEARELNSAWLHVLQRGHSEVTLKLATTLDGALSLRRGERSALSSPVSLAAVHRMRARADAVMVGVGTVLLDDPLLTNRSGRGSQPIRVVLDSQLHTPVVAKMLTAPGRTILVTGPTHDEERATRLRERGAEILISPIRDGRIALRDLLSTLASLGVHRVFCEGGARLANALIAEQLVDRLLLFQTPHFAERDAPRLGEPPFDLTAPFKVVAARRISTDAMIELRPNRA